MYSVFNLKPESIMIRGINKKLIKIIDFGTSCETGKSVYKFRQSRFFRAPVVTLRFESILPIDLWPAGCILAYLYMGKPLFESRSEFTYDKDYLVRDFGTTAEIHAGEKLGFKKCINLIRAKLSQAAH